jgi:hypothetical protein
MSERLYRKFFLATAEAAEQPDGVGRLPFQFIAATTSPPPEELGAAQRDVTASAPKPGEALLSVRQLSPQLIELGRGAELARRVNSYLELQAQAAGWRSALQPTPIRRNAFQD